MRWFKSFEPNFAADFAAFLAHSRGSPANVDAVVASVIDAVRRDGSAAVARLSAEFDGFALTEATMRVSTGEIEAGAALCPAEVREALRFAAARISDYHRRQLPADTRYTDPTGIELGWRWRPIAAVGIYVPGGRAAYPSTVLMNSVPARIAGVERIAMATPPGRLEPAVLAAALEAGVTEIWRIGGAQAIAALAFGAGPLEKVDKIVGPGNAYVTAAKRRLYGVVGLDSLAGPSEIVVVADAANDPAWIAADLLSQAEHDPDAQSILITNDEAFAGLVCESLHAQLLTLATREVAAAAWRAHGAVIIAPLDRAPELVNMIAPEHVEFAVDDPEALADKVDHAGAIFLGRHAPEAIGDYTAGANHILPTSGAARFSSGLSVLDFLKRTSVVKADAEGFAALAGPTMVLAEAEGLPAHARSVSVRIDRRG